MSDLITSYSLLHTRFSQPLNPPTCVTLSLPTLLARFAVHCIRTNSRKCTRTSVVTLAPVQPRLPFEVTNRSFGYASLWNKLPVSFRQPSLINLLHFLLLCRRHALSSIHHSFLDSHWRCSWQAMQITL